MTGVTDAAGVSERSLEPIDVNDLERLAEIARVDLQHYIERAPQSRQKFATRILCVALCQGAAQHYLDGTSGVKDLDVFTFFAVGDGKEFPPRRRASYDFGPSKFGRNPDDIGYSGRRVDVMGRSIQTGSGETAAESLRCYLRTPRTATAWELRQKAVVIIDPLEMRGQVVWPELDEK